MNIVTNKGKQAMIMGCPMGAADLSKDFYAVHPVSGDRVLFGIDPEEEVKLTVTNEYGFEVEHTFQAGVQPYLLRGIKKSGTDVTVNYFI